MTVNLDDFSIKIGTIIGNLDVVFRDIAEIKNNANMLLSQNTDTALRLAVLENQQKAVQEIKNHLSTLVPLSNNKLEFIEHSFEELSDIIRTLEDSVKTVRNILEKDTWTPDIGELDDKLVMITQLLNDTKRVISTELLTRPSIRDMLLELVHRDPTGDKWGWGKQLTNAIEENFVTKLAEGILIIIIVLLFRFAENYYKSDNYKHIETSNQELQTQVENLKKQLEAVGNKSSKNQEELKSSVNDVGFDASVAANNVNPNKKRLVKKK